LTGSDVEDDKETLKVLAAKREQRDEEIERACEGVEIGGADLLHAFRQVLARVEVRSPSFTPLFHFSSIFHSFTLERDFMGKKQD
jgi:hypothetical protein